VRIAVVLNSSAGSLIGRHEAEEEVARHLAAAGLDAVLVPDHPDGLCARLEDAIALGADAVVVGGGDGTIAAAAARLQGTQIALGILPLGTMNMLAHDLGIPVGLAAAADALAQGEIRAIDVAEVNGEIYLCNAVIGSPSWLGRHRERHRGNATLRTRIAFARAGLRAAWRHRPMRLSVALDGQRPKRLWTRALAVANNRYAEGFGMVMVRPRLDAGELALYVARRYGIWWWVRLLGGMFLGSWRGAKLVQERGAREVVIRSPRTALRVMSDGEARILASPLVFRIHPRALRVIVPRRGEVASPEAAGGSASQATGVAAPQATGVAASPPS
jgi:diacylglycerol kinase family enzyme